MSIIEKSLEEEAQPPNPSTLSPASRNSRLDEPLSLIVSPHPEDVRNKRRVSLDQWLKGVCGPHDPREVQESAQLGPVWPEGVVRDV